MNVTDISVKDIEEVKNLLHERWENVLALPEAQKMHCMSVVAVNVVEYGRYATCDEWKVCHV